MVSSVWKCKNWAEGREDGNTYEIDTITRGLQVKQQLLGLKQKKGHFTHCVVNVTYRSVILRQIPMTFELHSFET